MATQAISMIPAVRTPGFFQYNGAPGESQDLLTKLEAESEIQNQEPDSVPEIPFEPTDAMRPYRSIGYDFSDALPDIQTSVERAYDDAEVPYSNDGINEQLAVWSDAKAPLAALFSQHPAWDSNLLAIRQENEYYNLVPDPKAIRNFWQWFETEITKQNVIPENYYRDPETNLTLQEALNALADYEKNFGVWYETSYGRYITSRAVPESRFYIAPTRMTHTWYTLNSAIRDLKLKPNFEDVNGNRYNLAPEAESQMQKMLDVVEIMSTVTDRFCEEDLAIQINNIVPEAKAAKGKKMAKIARALCVYFGINAVEDIRETEFTSETGEVITRRKDYGFNHQIAVYGDAINPVTIEAPTYISINPVDYLRMSHLHSGNSSCHSLHNRGCHCSGTYSYMLDSTTFVVYSIDPNLKSESKISDPEFRNKFYRCVFSFENNKLLQSRVYPASNDYDNGIYMVLRNIVQTVLAECLHTENMWTNKKGTEICKEETNHYGTHYPDCHHYEKCNISYLKSGNRISDPISIGHDPICPNCGDGFTEEDKAVCEFCTDDTCRCENCGGYVGREDYDRVEIENQYGDWIAYCSMDCAYEDGWVQTDDTYCWERAEDCRRDSYTGEWFYNCNDGYETQNGNWYATIENAERDGYALTEEGDLYPTDEVRWTTDGYCYHADDVVDTGDGDCYHRDDVVKAEDGEYYHPDNTYTCPECGRIFYQDNYDAYENMCLECLAAENAEDDSESESENSKSDSETESKTDNRPMVSFLENGQVNTYPFNPDTGELGEIVKVNGEEVIPLPWTA